MHPTVEPRNIVKALESLNEASRVYLKMINTRMQAGKGGPLYSNGITALNNYYAMVEKIEEVGSLLQLAESKLGPDNKTFIKGSEDYIRIVEAMKAMLVNMSASSQQRTYWVYLT